MSSGKLIEPPVITDTSLLNEEARKEAQSMINRLYRDPKALQERLDELGDDTDCLGRLDVSGVGDMVKALSEPIIGADGKSIEVSSLFIKSIVERAEKLNGNWISRTSFLQAQKDTDEDEDGLARRIAELMRIKDEGYENRELEDVLADLTAKQEVVLAAEREKELENESATTVQERWQALLRGRQVRRQLPRERRIDLARVGTLLKEGEIDPARALLNTMKEKHKGLGATVDQSLACLEQSVAKHESARAIQALGRGRKVRKQLTPERKERLAGIAHLLESDFVPMARLSLNGMKEQYKGAGAAVDACLACCEYQVAKHEVAREQRPRLTPSTALVTDEAPDYRSRNMAMGIGGGSALVTVIAALWHRYQAAMLRERIAQQLGVSSDTITADGIDQMLASMHDNDRLAEGEFDTLSQAKKLFLDHRQHAKRYAGTGIGLGLGTAVLASILHGRAAAAA